MGKPVLYINLKKALYGQLKSALLFYRKLVVNLTSLGFSINQFDPCVGNKIINRKQMTIVWHVDDLLICMCNLKKSTKSLIGSASDTKLQTSHLKQPEAPHKITWE